MNDSTNQLQSCYFSQEIDSFILTQADDIYEKLTKIRNIIKDVMPKAFEVLNNKFLCFLVDEQDFCAVSFKRRFISLKLCERTLVVLESRLADYKMSKDTLYFRSDFPLDEDLIIDVMKVHSSGIEKGRHF